MRIFEYLSGCLAPRNSLCEALELLPFDRNIISFVGGQGKTAAVYQLCSELSRAGVPCAAVAAADMEIPRDYPCCTSEDPEEVRKAVQQRPFCVFGGSGGEGRLCAPSEPVWKELLASVPNLMIVSDAVKPFPVKLPDKPSVPPQTTLMIAVCGLDAVGNRLDEICPDPEQAAASLGRDADHGVTPSDLAKLFRMGEGYSAYLPARADFAVLLDGADSAYGIQLAEQTARRLSRRDVQKIVVASTLPG